MVAGRCVQGHVEPGRLAVGPVTFPSPAEGRSLTLAASRGLLPAFGRQYVRQCLHPDLRLHTDFPIWGVRGWRGQAPRQPGQVRKEAATTSPAWVAVQPLTPPPFDTNHCCGAVTGAVGWCVRHRRRAVADPRADRDQDRDPDKQHNAHHPGTRASHRSLSPLGKARADSHAISARIIPAACQPTNPVSRFSPRVNPSPVGSAVMARPTAPSQRAKGSARSRSRFGFQTCAPSPSRRSSLRRLRRLRVPRPGPDSASAQSSRNSASSSSPARSMARRGSATPSSSARRRQAT
jgi:hypothetical protein